MAVVYRHRRLDTNKVFYIGIGKNESRAYTKSGRNNLWNKIISKTQYQVEILYNNISIEEARELEEFLINIYGRKDLNKGELANLTNGGEKNRELSPETIKIISEKVSKTLKGRKLPKEQVEKIAKANKGKKRTKEQIDKVKEAFHKNKVSKAVAVTDFYTKEYYGEFYSVSDACRNLNLDTKKYAESLRKVANKTRNRCLNYTCEYVDFTVDLKPKIKKKRKELEGNLVLNKVTGIFYISAKQAYYSHNLKITVGSFTRKLKGNRINDTDFIYV